MSYVSTGDEDLGYYIGQMTGTLSAEVAADAAVAAQQAVAASKAAGQTTAQQAAAAKNAVVSTAASRGGVPTALTQLPLPNQAGAANIPMWMIVAGAAAAIFVLPKLFKGKGKPGWSRNPSRRRRRHHSKRR